MKIRTALLLVPVLLALCVGTAVAKPPPTKSGVDPSFGHGGTIAISTPKGAAEKPIQMATAPSGKSYVLAGSLLLAFRADGRPDTGFAPNGRLKIAAPAGETTEVNGLAVDAQGRVLVSGSIDPTPGTPVSALPSSTYPYLWEPASNAFVARYLPDGERDPTFGGAGLIEVTLTPPARPTAESNDPHLESPAVHGARLAVVNGEQPVLGGSYAYAGICYSGEVPANAFVGAINPGGASLQNLAATAYTQVPQSTVTDFASMPGGNLVALSDPARGCGLRGETWTTTLSSLTFGSTPAPTLDPARPVLSLGSLAVDSSGRYLGLEGPEEFPPGGGASPWKLVRLLPNGDYDTGFGSYGGVALKKFGSEPVRGLAVDAKQRAIVGGGETEFRVARFGTKGKIDKSFGNHGWVEVGFGSGSKATLDALSIDPEGRIVAVGGVKSSALKTGEGIALTRITTK